MAIRKTIVLFFSFLSLINCTSGMTSNTAQSNPRIPNSTIRLGRYIIDPVDRTVSNPHYWEKDETLHGKRRHSFGVTYKPDSLIDAQTTCLYIDNHKLVFKEHYSPVQDNSKEFPEVDGYTVVNGLYEKGGRFYHLSGWHPYEFEEIEIPEGVDFTRLIFVDGNTFGNSSGYLYDKTGLYYLEPSAKPSERFLKLADGGKEVPVIRNYYCEYNGEVFQLDKKIGRKEQFTEFDIERDGETVFLTDGKTLFRTSRSYTENREFPGMDQWIQLTDGSALGIEEDGVYFPPSPEHKKVVYFDLLFATPDGYVVTDNYIRNDPRKVDQVFIKPGVAYEPLDLPAYSLYAKGFYTYRDVIYQGSVQIKNNFDMPNLTWITREGWLSDGKLLTHHYLRNVNPETPHEGEYKCVTIADPKTLKIATRELLMDSVNFYQFDQKGIEVIPLESFWFDIEVISAVSAF